VYTLYTGQTQVHLLSFSIIVLDLMITNETEIESERTQHFFFYTPSNSSLLDRDGVDDIIFPWSEPCPLMIFWIGNQKIRIAVCL
jgi:hypothetical protein